MYKLMSFILFSVFLMMLQALQFDEEIAMHSLFQAKYALNRATHAAAQQLDQQKLASGIHSIDEDLARATALYYLQKNLNLDSENHPLPGSFFRSAIKVLEFEVINEHHQFPYTYTHVLYDYQVTLQRPGVIMIIEVQYPGTYNILAPITWQIKSVSESVFLH